MVQRAILLFFFNDAESLGAESEAVLSNLGSRRASSVESGGSGNSKQQVVSINAHGSNFDEIETKSFCGMTAE